MPDRQTLRTPVALLLGVSLSACSFIPALQRPAAPVPEAYPAPTSTTISTPAPAASTAAPVALSWQSYFQDPTLQQLVSLALGHNRDLRLALLNIEQAAAQLGLKRADQWPTISAALAASRASTTSGTVANSFSAGFAVTAFELDLFGRVAALKEQAAAQLLATQEASQAARLSLVSAVAQGWVALLSDADQALLARQTLETREQTLALIELRVRHGAASELELRQAQSLREAARVALVQAERQRAQDENALALLIGQPLPPEVRARIVPQQLVALELAPLQPGLPSELLQRRPDIRQAEQQLVAANANIGAARAAFFPRISLTASTGTASNELSNLFKDGFWAFSIAPQLLAPVFDAGRNQAGLESARVGLDIAVAQFEKSIQSAFREVSDALAATDTLQRQVQAQQAQAQADEQRNRLVQLRLEHGASSLLDSLDAQRSMFASQQALLQARQALAQSRITLFKVLGGGL